MQAYILKSSSLNFSMVETRAASWVPAALWKKKCQAWATTGLVLGSVHLLKRKRKRLNNTFSRLLFSITEIMNTNTCTKCILYQFTVRSCLFPPLSVSLSLWKLFFSSCGVYHRYSRRHISSTWKHLQTFVSVPVCVYNKYIHTSIYHPRHCWKDFLVRLLLFC